MAHAVLLSLVLAQVGAATPVPAAPSAAASVPAAGGAAASAPAEPSAAASVPAVAAAATSVPPGPPVTATVPADAPEPTETMRATGNDDTGGGATPPGTFTWRTLTQVRYGNTWVSPDSLVQAGDPHPWGLAAGRALYGAEVVGTDNVASLQTEQARALRDPDGYKLNRVFLRLTATPTRALTAKLLVDFAELVRNNARRTLKLAYAEYAASRRIEVTAGLFKRTFSLLELLPIADYELADVGAVDNLIKELGFGGRDVGVMARVSPLAKRKQLSLFVAGFGGDVRDGWDSSPGKLLTARAESRLSKFLRVGADVAWRPWATERYSSISATSAPAGVPYVDYDKGAAGSADVTLSLGNLEVRTEVMGGHRTDRWHADAKTFMAAWALAALRIPVGEYAVMPVLRGEWLDLDREHSTGQIFYVTAGLNFEVGTYTKVLVDVSRYDAQRLTPAFDTIPWRSGNTFNPIYDADYTRLIVQLQVKL